MSHAPDVTTHGVSRQQASTSFVDASINHQQGPVTLEVIYYLLLESNARAAHREQTVPSPEPRTDNQVIVRQAPPQASQQSIRLSKKQRRHNLRWRSKQRQLTSWLKSMVTLDTVLDKEMCFAATSGVINPVDHMARVCMHLHVINPANRIMHFYTRVNPAGGTAGFHMRLHHSGDRGNTPNALKNQFWAPHALHDQRNGQTLGCTRQVFDPGGTHIQVVKVVKR